jgi:hypothetical protein
MSIPRPNFSGKRIYPPNESQAPDETVCNAHPTTPSTLIQWANFGHSADDSFNRKDFYAISAHNFRVDGVLPDFTTFDGKLMIVLHSPNGPAARPRIFEMEDTGDTLKIAKEFTGTTP